ncbi:hypothetical protein ACFU8I_11035 [Streptomyces sp. NPDC057540]|uniref:hypothetical protein n=1 Tax=Streptomyces sp. NPDC057540 TaxID=3346160 RepID=UPI00367399A7
MDPTPPPWRSPRRGGPGGGGARPPPPRGGGGAPPRPVPARPAEFGRLWTRKEAYLKGIGTGLAHGTSTEYLGADARGRPPGWTVLDLDLAEDRAYAAAVAVRAEGVRAPEVRERGASFLRAAVPAV